MPQVIEVVISPDGQTTIETKGFSGTSCRDASRFVEEAIGSRINEQLSPEYFQTKYQEQSNNQFQ